MKCYRIIVGISKIDHFINDAVWETIGEEIRWLEDIISTAKKRKVKWYGHVILASNVSTVILQGTSSLVKEEEADRGKYGLTTSLNGLEYYSQTLKHLQASQTYHSHVIRSDPMITLGHRKWRWWWIILTLRLQSMDKKKGPEKEKKARKRDIFSIFLSTFYCFTVIYKIAIMAVKRWTFCQSVHTRLKDAMLGRFRKLLSINTNNNHSSNDHVVCTLHTSAWTATKYRSKGSNYNKWLKQVGNVFVSFQHLIIRGGYGKYSS